MQDAFKKAGFKPIEEAQKPTQQNQQQPTYQNQNITNARPPYANPQNRNSNPQPPTRTAILAKELPKDYVDLAEKHFLKVGFEKTITTSKIRKFLTQIIEVYHDERIRQKDTLSPESISIIQLIRMRMLYEAGRDSGVKQFIRETELVEYLKGIGESRLRFIDYTHYLEALVAYHRYYGGKE